MDAYMTNCIAPQFLARWMKSSLVPLFLRDWEVSIVFLLQGRSSPWSKRLQLWSQDQIWVWSEQPSSRFVEKILKKQLFDHLGLYHIYVPNRYLFHVCKIFTFWNNVDRKMTNNVQMSTAVASIAENTGGGLYAYRCSKAGLNMSMKVPDPDWSIP